MLLLDNIQNSSDLATSDAKHKIEMDAKSAKEKFDVASNIVSKFIDSILADTLTKTDPTSIFNYDIDPGIDLKSLQVLVDDIIYRLFNKNIYAIPDVFVKNKSDVCAADKIVISAPNTVKCILATDKRLDRELTSLLSSKSGILQNGNAVVYTGFEHLISSMPHAYTTSRCQSVIKSLEDKGYTTQWEPTSMYLTISIN